MERRWRDGELELWEGWQGDGGVGGEKTWWWFEEEVKERAGREL